MTDLTASRRAGMSQSQFAMPGKRFPINDKEHARLAIGGATRSEHAGNISPAMADKIKAAARKKLDQSHALSIGGAKHQLAGGHISQQQHDHIVKSAKGAIGTGEKGQPFGSLAP
jgi:hypothetical protein